MSDKKEKETKNTRAYRQGIIHERQRILRILENVKWLTKDEKASLSDRFDSEHA